VCLPQSRWIDLFIFEKCFMPFLFFFIHQVNKFKQNQKNQTSPLLFLLFSPFLSQPELGSGGGVDDDDDDDGPDFEGIYCRVRKLLCRAFD